jgi:hypothetical protein
MPATYDEKIAVSFARDVYRHADRPPLPDGWSVYYDCPIELQKEGYFGSAYRCVKQFSGREYSYIVIAHRGTDNSDGIIEDAEMKLFDTIPQQFYDGAIPFIQAVFDKLDQDYPYTLDRTGGFHGEQVYIAFTGHSLGATLTELSIIRYVNYFVCDFHGEDNWSNCCRIIANSAYVFDSPGSKNLVAQQLKNKEITEQDIADGSRLLSVYNSDVDAINTCLQTSATSSIRSGIGNKYSSLTNGSKLPYAPDPLYYFSDYSVNDQHPITYIYDWVQQGSVWHSISIASWPIGFNTGYRAYKTYYGSYPDEHGLIYHNNYWDQYTTVYWDQNPGIHDEYDDKLFAFQDDYFRNVCYYFDGYALPREISYKFNLADMQRIERFLSVEDKLMASSLIVADDQDQGNSRRCCGFGFFQVVAEAQQIATNAAESVVKVVTETGEELSSIMPSSSIEHQKQSFLFFRSAAQFFSVDNRFETSNKSTPSQK